jgi:hypothetical protein
VFQPGIDQNFQGRLAELTRKEARWLLIRKACSRVR